MTNNIRESISSSGLPPVPYRVKSFREYLEAGEVRIGSGGGTTAAEPEQEFISSQGFRLSVIDVRRDINDLRARLNITQDPREKQALRELIIKKQAKPTRPISELVTERGEIVTSTTPAFPLQQQLNIIAREKRAEFEKKERLEKFPPVPYRVKSFREQAEAGAKPKLPPAPFKSPDFKKTFEDLKKKEDPEKEEIKKEPEAEPETGFKFEIKPDIPFREPLTVGELQAQFKETQQQTRELLQVAGAFVGKVLPKLEEKPEVEAPEAVVIGKEAALVSLELARLGILEGVSAGVGGLSVIGKTVAVGTERAIPEFELSAPSPIKIGTPLGTFEGVFLDRQKVGKVTGLAAELATFEAGLRVVRGADIAVSKGLAATQLRTPAIAGPAFLASRGAQVERIITKLKIEAKGGLEPIAKTSFKPQAAPVKKIPISEKFGRVFEELGEPLRETRITPIFPSRQKVITLLEKKIPRPRDIKRDISRDIKISMEELGGKIESTAIDLKPLPSRIAIKRPLKSKLELEANKFKEPLEELSRKIESTAIDLKPLPKKVKIERTLKDRIQREGDQFRKTLQEAADKTELGVSRAAQKTELGIDRTRIALIETPRAREIKGFFQAAKRLPDLEKKAPIPAPKKPQPQGKEIEIGTGEGVVVKTIEGTPGSAVQLGKQARGFTLRGRPRPLEFDTYYSGQGLTGAELQDLGVRKAEAEIQLKGEAVKVAEELAPKDILKEATKIKLGLTTLAPIKAFSLLGGPAEALIEEITEDTKKKEDPIKAVSIRDLTETRTRERPREQGRIPLVPIGIPGLPGLDTGEQVEGYNAIGFEKGKPVKLNPDPLTFNQAMALASNKIDNRTSASGTVNKAGKTLPKPFMDPTPNLEKFTIKQTKKGTRIIEKNKYRIDTFGELKGIPLEAQRLRKLGVI